MGQFEIASASKQSRLCVLLLWLVVAVFGTCVFWNSGAVVSRRTTATDGANDNRNDLQAYRRIVDGVRDGGNYYDVARGILPEYYQRYNSVFNWRLPTYAYVLAWLRSDAIIRAILMAIIASGLILNLIGERSLLGIIPAFLIAALQGIAFSWVFQDAIYAQELWAAALLTLSLGAWGAQYRWLAIVAGLGTVAFRELMLPYPVMAMVVCWWADRRREAVGWLMVLALFATFFLWHRSQVQSQVAQLPPLAGGSIDQWLKLGGMDFVLLTGRLSNPFLLGVPGGVVFGCLWLAILGLATIRGERGRAMLATTLTYLGAFLIIGEPHNLYWGLLYAPLICIGFVHGLVALYQLPTGRSLSQ